MDASTIYQRTESGRETIRTKSQKLTQSERLLLIIIDGVTPMDVLRKEVWSLSADRFGRALKTLLKKELISEVLLPLQGQEAEQLDASDVDRFLQQDPLDPVTIISFDPEDEFGADFNPFAPAAPAAVKAETVAPSARRVAAEPAVEIAAETEVAVAPQADVAVEERPEPEAEPERESLALKSLAIELAHEKEHEADPASASTSAALPQPAMPDPVANLDDNWPENLDRMDEASNKSQWIYWAALISGISLICGSLLYRVFT